LQWAVLGPFWRTGLAMEHSVVYATMVELSITGGIPGLLLLPGTESRFVRLPRTSVRGLLISDRGQFCR
ncbi:MAG: hypothetical protein ACE5JI_00795, partial [Acidobacteriota bacterium]